MSESEIREVISGYIPHFREEYTGPLNDDNQRHGEGDQLWKDGDFQKYTGNFFQDSLHGKGNYVWLQKTQNYMHDGTMYANKIEGYSTLMRTDGQYFEGLMKHNRRFGPGVLTYPDGSQDVGLWSSNKLRRLSCVVMADWVPRLARSPGEKVKLLKYRKLVPICPETEDFAKEILRDMGANSEVLDMSDTLYNKFIRNSKNKLFNKRLLDGVFFGEDDCTIDVAVSSADDVKTSVTLESFSSVSTEKKQVGNIIEGTIEVLLENVDILQEIHVEERENFLYESLERIRNEHFVKELVDTILIDVDNLLQYGQAERTLILNKRMTTQTLLKDKVAKENMATKKLVVSDLLAWNNENILIDMMKHIFLHRNMEDVVSFRVCKLLAGDRSAFNKCGDHERVCILFLTNCSVGNDDVIVNIMLNYDLNPDICDAQGNAGITFAAVRDRWSTIRKLTNFGANLDILNDEGLTPLQLCIVRYLAIKNSIKSWDRAFLSTALVTKEEEAQILEWCPHLSTTNLNLVSVTTLYETYGDLQRGLKKLRLPDKPKPMQIAKDADSADQVLDILNDVYEEIKDIEIDMTFKNFQEPYTYQPVENQECLFKCNCIVPPAEKTPKEKGGLKKGRKKKKAKEDKSTASGKLKAKKSRSNKSKESKRTKNSEKFDHAKDNKEKQQSPEELIQANKLKVVFATIKILLSCGADPNIGQVPVGALIACIFCGNTELLKLLLKANANPNVNTIDENLTSLHILASLPFSSINLEMFRILLENGANPNSKANVYHWMEEKNTIIGKHVLIAADLGKTPLHILCMRYDFLNDEEQFLEKMVRHLIESKANLNEYYLGHTPLSLAMLRGNLKLLQYFLGTGLVDPNQKLGEDMGIALTVLILKRYSNFMPPKIAEKMYDLLLEHNVNPLTDIEESGNAIEFMDREYEDPKGVAERKKLKKKKKTKSSKSNKSSKSSKKSKKAFDVEVIKDYLVDCGRKMLERHVQYDAFKYLTYFILENADLYDDITEILAKFCSLADTERIIQLLVHKGVFSPCDQTYNTCLQILNLVKTAYVPPKRSKHKNKSEDSRTPEDILAELDWRKLPGETKFGLVEPELDRNKGKYEVCFYCCRRCGKDLLACTKCGLVYFCSEQCNKLSNKQNNAHKCGILFYNKEKKRRDEAIARGSAYDVLSKLKSKLDIIKDGAKLRDMYKDGQKDGGKFDMSSDFDLLDSKFKDGRYADMFGVGKGAKDKKAVSGAAPWKVPRPEQDKAKYKTKHRKNESGLSASESSETKLGKKGKGGEQFDEASKEAKTRGDKMKAVGGKSGRESREDKRSRKGKVKMTDSYTSAGRKRAGKFGKQSDKGSRGPGKRGAKHDKIDFGSSAGRKRAGKFGKQSDKGSSGPGKRGAKHEKFSEMVKPGKYDKSSRMGKSGRGIGREALGASQTGRGRYDNKYGKFGRRVGEGPGGVAGGLRKDVGLYRGDAAKAQPDMLGAAGLRIPGRMVGIDDIDAYGYPRISNKYQYFMERLSKFFPDLDLSMLFLPYACFVDGQLYYRCLDEKPAFCQTYSNV